MRCPTCSPQCAVPFARPNGLNGQNVVGETRKDKSRAPHPRVQTHRSILWIRRLVSLPAMAKRAALRLEPLVRQASCVSGHQAPPALSAPVRSICPTVTRALNNGLLSVFVTLSLSPSLQGASCVRTDTSERELDRGRARERTVLTLLALIALMVIGGHRCPCAVLTS